VFRVSSDRILLWSLLAVPAAGMAWTWRGEAEPWLADYVAATGLWSARLLIVALCLTPLRELFGHSPWLAWTIRRRRAIGVAAFCYALLHLILYVADMADFGAILDEATAPAMIAGWLGFAAMLPAALISNDPAMRALGPAWKRIQRLAYPAAILTLLHWLWVHDGSGEAIAHFLPLALLQSIRLARGLGSLSQRRTVT
jgi:sulfoxide reductase heme-binding subunit YedZ